ncbi:MAG: hypothetical protein WD810_07820 [Solirubrobacterales bacterium]
MRQIADLSSFAQGHLFPGGNLFAVGSAKFSCSGRSGPPVALSSFDTNGNLVPGFGFSGFRSVGYRSAPVAALAPSGKILLLGSRRNTGKHEAQQLAMRLLPDGAMDAPSDGTDP